MGEQLFGAEHVRRYLETDGRKATSGGGAHILHDGTNRDLAAHDEYQEKTERRIPVAVLERV